MDEQRIRLSLTPSVPG